MSSPRSLTEIAELIGGKLEGNGSLKIHGVADLQGPVRTNFHFSPIRDMRPRPEQRRPGLCWWGSRHPKISG